MEASSVWTHRSWRPLPTFLYRTVWSFFAYAQDDGERAGWVLHIINILAHAVNSSMVFVATKSLLLSLSSSSSLLMKPTWLPPLLTSLLFALHPVHVDAVANVTHGCELLSAFFLLLGMHTYLSSDRAVVTGRALAGVTILTILAILCKETAFLMWPFLATLELAFLRRRRWEGTCVYLLLLFASLLYLRVSASAGMSFDMDPEFNPLIPLAPLSFPWFRAIGAAHRDVAALLFNPLFSTYSFDRAPPLTELFPANEFEAKVGDVKSAVMYLLLLGLVGHSCRGFAKHHHSRVTLAAVGWFVFSYLPASQIFFKNGFFVAERTLYMGSVATSLFAATAFLTLGGWVKEQKERKERKEQQKHLLPSLVVLVLAALAAKSHAYASTWSDPLTLYSTTLATGRASYNSYRGLGQHHYVRGNLDESIRFYDLAISKKEEEGKLPMLIDQAMAGRVRLHKFMTGGVSEAEEGAFLERTKADLVRAADNYHYMQARSTHDLGLMIWLTCCNHYVDERNVGELYNSKLMLVGVLDHIERFAALSARNIAMMYNNAACATLLFQLAAPDYEAGLGPEALVIQKDPVECLDAALQIGTRGGLHGVPFERHLKYKQNKALAYVIGGGEGWADNARRALGDIVAERAQFGAGEGREEQELREIIGKRQRGEEVDLRVCHLDWDT